MRIDHETAGDGGTFFIDAEGRRLAELTYVLSGADRMTINPYGRARRAVREGFRSGFSPAMQGGSFWRRGLLRRLRNPERIHDPVY